MTSGDYSIEIVTSGNTCYMGTTIEVSILSYGCGAQTKVPLMTRSIILVNYCCI